MGRLLVCAILIGSAVAGMGRTQPVHAQDSTFRATYYGPMYEGRNMGCAGAGAYRAANPGILAVPPSMYHVPCGASFVITGPAGQLQVTRTDSCPGCDDYGMPIIDLSEAGIIQVCGSLGSCTVTVRRDD